MLFGITGLGIRVRFSVKMMEENFDGGTHMNDKLTEKELQQVIERRSTGKTSFGEFLEELSQIGVIQYDINVATGQATYKGESSEVKTDPQVQFVISNDFNRNKALKAIASIALPFLDFLRELASAGVTTYNVNIIEKKATYLGMNGDQIVEPLQLS
jgi:uncharacterized protein YbcV (DUF1398 family)